MIRRHRGGSSASAVHQSDDGVEDVRVAFQWALSDQYPSAPQQPQRPRDLCVCVRKMLDDVAEMDEVGGAVERRRIVGRECLDALRAQLLDHGGRVLHPKRLPPEIPRGANQIPGAAAVVDEPSPGPPAELPQKPRRLFGVLYLRVGRERALIGQTVHAGELRAGRHRDAE